MASSVKDIVVGSVWRPRSVVKQVTLRDNDKAVVKTVSQSNQSTELEYIGDGALVIVSFQCLIDEYKIDSKVAQPSKQKEQPHGQPSVYNQGVYTLGTLWKCEGPPLKQGLIVRILKHSESEIEYEYTHNNSTNRKAPAIFKAAVKPYVEPANDNSCKHKATSWYGDEESCRDCGETVNRCTNNPYAVDPDVRAAQRNLEAYLNARKST